VKRRHTVSRKPAKTRHRKTTKPKRNSAPRAARQICSSVADLQEQVSALARELAEARDQQTATSDVLRVIGSSPGELQPVFNSMLENAVRICDAKFGAVYRCEGDTLRFLAMHDAPPALAELSRYAPFRPSPKHYFGRLMATKAVVHVADLSAEETALERCTEREQFTASITLPNSTMAPSPISFTMRPLWAATAGLKMVSRCRFRAASVPASSAPISRE
jgi:hypothetical protein